MDFFYKAMLKLFRIFGLEIKIKIKSGHLKGLLWNVSIPDSRYIIGNYEPALAKIIINEINKGKQFIDIGANSGYFSMMVAKISPKKVLAVEPMPENLKILKDHLKINKISNVDVFEQAIALSSGEVQFSLSDNLAANTYKEESSMFTGTTKKITVKTESLTDFALKHSLSDNYFLKIDVEGAEYDVLKGGESFLKKYHPNMMLATHDCHVPGVKQKCLDFVKELGYQVKTIEDNKIDGQEDFLVFTI